MTGLLGDLCMAFAQADLMTLADQCIGGGQTDYPTPDYCDVLAHPCLQEYSMDPACRRRQQRSNEQMQCRHYLRLWLRDVMLWLRAPDRRPRTHYPVIGVLRAAASYRNLSGNPANRLGNRRRQAAEHHPACSDQGATPCRGAAGLQPVHPGSRAVAPHGGGAPAGGGHRQGIRRPARGAPPGRQPARPQ
ncbi:hypothetical protein D3C85_973820 [compost metagenome]